MKPREVVSDSTSGRRMKGLVLIAALAAMAGCILPPPPPPPPPAPPAAGTAVPVQVATWCDPAGNPGTQAQCAASHIFWDPALSSIDQTVRVRAIGPATYFPIAWTGGYLGVQTGGNSVSGVIGSTAVFSLAGAGVSIGTVNGLPNPNCQSGFDTDQGASCRVPLPAQIAVGDVYTYRVTRTKAGWIRGQVVLPTGQAITIARLHPGPDAPANFQGLYNFIEYFGAPVASIALVPRSRIEFAPPDPTARITSVDRLLGACARATNDGAWGLRLQLGGSGCTP